MSRLPFRKLCTAAAAAAFVAIATPAAAQGTIKIGEINSYKAQPAFLEPYKKGMELARRGDQRGRRRQRQASSSCITRDDNGNPGDAVRVAEELVSREKVDVLDRRASCRNIGLALADFAKQKKVFFLAAEPLTDKIVWQNGNRYTFRLRPSTYMQAAMLVPEAAKLKKKRWAIVYPNYEYGQSAAATFKAAAEGRAARRRVRRRAGAAARQDRRRQRGAGAGRRQARRDLQRAVRRRPGQVRARGQHPRPVRGPRGGQPADRRARVPRPAEGRDARTAGSSPATPGTAIQTPEHKAFLDAYQTKFNDYPRLGSVVGYTHDQVDRRRHRRRPRAPRPRSWSPRFKGLQVDTPFGKITYRAAGPPVHHGRLRRARPRTRTARA